MKANELRIGNLVKKGDEMFMADFLTIRMAINYEPIPLTEEWLIKFGFERNDNTKLSDSFYWIMVGRSELHINPDNGVLWIHRNENIFNNPCLVKHVHQIQNLYFALTGEELILTDAT